MRDQVAGLEHGLALWRVARQDMEVANRNSALAFCSADMNGSLERSHGYVHIGRICRNALLARAEDREVTIKAIDRAATGARLALVTRHRGVAEIHATRPLQQVAGSRCHVANLHGCSAQDRFGKDTVVLSHERVPGEL